MPISRDQSGETGETRYGDEGHEDASSSGPIQNLELFVNASVGGPLKRFEQDAVIENLETGEKETRKVGFATHIRRTFFKFRST